jgi:hypothetical protein
MNFQPLHNSFGWFPHAFPYAFSQEGIMQRLFWKTAVAGIALMAPVISLADDQATAQAVAANLKGSLRNYNVAVKVQDGTAWLNGTVANERQMGAALDVANQTEGVERVVNNLSIATPSAPGPRASQSSLRQPSQIAETATAPSYIDQGEPQSYGGQYQPARRQVMQAGAALPDRAQNQLQAAGATANYDDGPQANGYYSGTSRMPRAALEATTTSVRAPSVAKPAGMQRDPATIDHPRSAMPLAMNSPNPNAGRPPMQPVAMQNGGEMIGAPQPMPTAMPMGPGSPAPYHYDSPSMPGYAWPSYAAYPNYAAVTYPKQYSPTAWPYIGPFYPYPQVPLGWRKVTLEWKDGWWFLDFKDNH